LYAGYHKFRLTKNIKEETKKCLDNLQKDNLNRDQSIANYFNMSVECPYLDKDLINYSLNIDPKYLISKTQNKIIIREIGKDLGLTTEFY
jgi:asparagine synthetase B (glutamine-hydrolysing)